MNPHVGLLNVLKNIPHMCMSSIHLSPEGEMNSARGAWKIYRDPKRRGIHVYLALGLLSHENFHSLPEVV